MITPVSGPKRTIKVFIASPGDLAVERQAFKEQVELLNLGFGDGANVRFVPLGWEDTLATTGRRPQSVINREIDQSDVFILAMFRRWGQPAPDAVPYTSYTEEEFHRALDRFTKTGSPEVFVFFKNVDAASMADPGEQLKRVLEFRRSLEESRQVRYGNFADDNGFRHEVDRHLRTYAKNELPPRDTPREPVVLPQAYVDKVRQAEEKARQEAERAEKVAAHAEDLAKRAEAEAARADQLALMLAGGAAKAALEGRIEEARQDFAKALDGSTNLNVLNLGAEFFNRIGELDEAERLLRRSLAINGPDLLTPGTAAAYGNLGLIYRTRGDLDRA